MEELVVNAASMDDPFVGKMLAGRYRIEKLIGSGGWGNVYLGTHATLGTPIAVKVLHQHFARDQERQKRLEQEARILSKIDSQFVVKTMDYGLTPIAFIVMEYFDGDSLSDLLDKHGAIPQAEAVIIFEQLCEGLLAAHSVGMIHRDLKPSNILVKETDGEMRAKILDFGVAKMMDDNSGSQKLTATGEILGSPAYMSPEQWTARGLDVRSDIYSLGCLMYEVLAGKPMFEAGNSFEYLNLHISAEPKNFSKTVPHLAISSDLEKVVRKCVQKDPENRYASVEELFEDLQKVRSGKRVTMRMKAATRKSPASSGSLSSKIKWPVFIIIAALIGGIACVFCFKEDILISICSNKNQQADHEAKLGKTAEAIQSYRNSLAAAQYLPKQDKRRLHAMRALAALLSKHGSFAESGQLTQKVKDDIGDINPPDWTSLYQKAVNFKNYGRWSQAEQAAKSTIAHAIPYGKHTIIYSLSLDLLGAVYRESGRGGKAAPLQQESLQIVEDLLEPDDRAISNRLNNLGLCLRQLNRLEEARVAYTRSIEICMRANRPEEAIRPYNNLGTTYIQGKDYEKALAACKHALELNTKANADVGSSIMDHIAIIYHKQGKLQEALAAYKSAVEYREKEGSLHIRQANETWLNMGILYTQLKEHAKAAECFKKCLENSNSRDPEYARYKKLLTDAEKAATN